MLTDPMWSARASPVQWAGPHRLTTPGVALDALPPIDVVLISHNHYDHLDAASVRAVARRHPSARWFAPLGVARYVRRWGARTVSELDWWDVANADGYTVACVPAQHASGRTPFNRMRSLWCGWTIRAGRHTIYFAGDTAYHPEFAEISRRHGPFDLCVLPIGAYEPRWFMQPVHVNPEEAVRIHLDVRARRSIGMHFGTFQLTDEAIDEPIAALSRARDAAGVPADAFAVLDFGETAIV